MTQAGSRSPRLPLRRLSEDHGCDRLARPARLRSGRRWQQRPSRRACSPAD